MATKELPKGLLLRGDTYHLRFTYKGNLVAESAHTKDLREAERLLNKKKAELHQLVVMGGGRITTLHKAVDEYVASILKTKGKNGARVALKKVTDAIPNKSVKKVEMHEIENVFSDLSKTYKASSVKLYKSYWNAFANWCEKQKYGDIGRFAIGTMKYGRIRFLTPDEQKKLLAELGYKEDYKGKNPTTDKARGENYDLTVMLLDTGLRYSEAAKMDWSQVDLDRKLLYVYRLKDGTPTTLSLTNRLYEVLVRRRKDVEGEYVFPTKLTNTNNGWKWMGIAAKRAGISLTQGNITPHICRHTFATTMVQNGVSLQELQHLLGHSSIEMSLRYAHFQKQDATAKAAAILNKQNEAIA
jgi:integrase